jgi:hypothetical protein
MEHELIGEGKSYVLIDDTTRLLMSPRNWQLQYKVTAKEKSKTPGKVSWESFRHYMTLESALKDLIHIKTSEETFKNATELLEANSRVVKRIVEAFTPQYKIELVNA